MRHFIFHFICALLRRLLRFFPGVVLSQALLVVALSHGAASAQGLALTLDRRGEVDVVSAGTTTRLHVLDYLAPESELRLPADASATLVYLPTSQEWQFTGPGRYRLQAGRPAVLQGAAPQARGVPAPAAQAMARLEPVQRERMALGALVMRAVSPLRLVSPNNVDVLAVRPTLLWSSPEGRAVRLGVFAEGVETPVATATVTTLQWTLPADLPPGQYSWRADLDGDTAGMPQNGRFRVIPADDPRRARMAAVPADFPQRVSRAVTLESDNLPHDALLLWRALAAERPDEPSIKQWAR